MAALLVLEAAASHSQLAAAWPTPRRLICCIGQFAMLPISGSINTKASGLQAISSGEPAALLSVYYNFQVQFFPLCFNCACRFCHCDVN
jgi:hypothetical protein